MPFTLAHPAATLPLLRLFGGRAAAVALVIGSMSPDLYFFVPFPVTRLETHSLIGLITFCLPTGLALVGLFHILWKEPIAGLLPHAIAHRLGPDTLTYRPSAADLLRSAILVPIGAATHLGWDALTHRFGALPERFDTLMVSVAGHSTFVVRLFQHTSTVVGLSVLAMVLLRWVRRTPRSSTPLRFPWSATARRWIWASFVLPTAALSIWSYHAGVEWSLTNNPDLLDRAWEIAGITFISGGKLAFLWLSAVSIACWLRATASRRSRAH